MCVPGTVETVRARADAEGIRLDRRSALLGAAAAAVAATVPGRALAAPRHSTKRLQDLTHEFRVGFPSYLGAPAKIERTTVVNIRDNGFYGQWWTFWEHSCTHMDVPAHFVEGGRFSPELTPEELIVPAVVIDISAKVPSNPDAMLTLDDVRSFERGHGRIPRRAVVCAYSGWESRVGSEAAYRNVGPDGLQHFPGLSAEAAEWLIDNRDVTGFGVDTLSLDPGNSTTFSAHLTILGADRYGIENLANLAKIPPRGATLYVGLVPWQEGSGGPARIIAAW
jgi:kynurenine formamidase